MDQGTSKPDNVEEPRGLVAFYLYELGVGVRSSLYSLFSPNFYRALDIISSSCRYRYMYKLATAVISLLIIS
jgi:hypothetical protein